MQTLTTSQIGPSAAIGPAFTKAFAGLAFARLSAYVLATDPAA